MTTSLRLNWQLINVSALLCLAIIICILPNSAMALLPFQKTGNLYVSMWSSDEIAVFTPEGTPVERFRADGLEGPRGIAFNPVNGEIWVAGEFSDAIFIFDHQHQFLRRLDHADFNEPVGITFLSKPGAGLSGQQVYVSNSNGNEIMVFDEFEKLVERFSGTELVDPNCSAFLQDGTLLVANRLGGTHGGSGAVSSFDSNNQFQFDFTATGIASLMAVARDKNDMQSAVDDTVWVTSGGGDNGIYEFDQAGNLLRSLLPADIDNGSAIVPQGIAFDDEGNFVVVSYLNEVIKFDSDGNFLKRFPTGSGTARSTAFQACEPQQSDSTECVALGTGVTPMPTIQDSGVLSESTSEMASDESTDSEGSSGGGGAISMWMLVMCFWLRRFADCS